MYNNNGWQTLHHSKEEDKINQKVEKKLINEKENTIRLQYHVKKQKHTINTTNTFCTIIWIASQINCNQFIYASKIGMNPRENWTGWQNQSNRYFHRYIYIGRFSDTFNI